MIPAVGGLLLILIAGFVGLRRFERAQVFQPTRNFALELDEHPWPGDEVWLDSSDGVRLHAWYFPCEDRPQASSWVILHSHGNAGNISHRFEVYDILKQTGAAVFAYEYRGYGRSSGRASEQGLYRDIETAYSWLREQGFPSERIIAHGNSLGAGPSAYLAERQPIGGLVLRSAFTNVPDLGKELFPWLPVDLVSGIEFPVAERLPQIQCPVVLLHGRDDRLIPIRHAEVNFAAANEPKFFYPILPGDHNDSCSTVAKDYVAAIREILREEPQ